METVRVVAAIVQRDDRYLVCRRSPGKAAAGKWEFPGGKIESGEAPEEALAREIREELGADISVIRLFDRSETVVDSVVVDLACYVCELKGEAPIQSTDHDQIGWFAENELSGLDWAEPDLPAVKKILIPFC